MKAASYKANVKTSPFQKLLGMYVCDTMQACTFMFHSCDTPGKVLNKAQFRIIPQGYTNRNPSQNNPVCNETHVTTISYRAQAV